MKELTSSMRMKKAMKFMRTLRKQKIKFNMIYTTEYIKFMYVNGECTIYLTENEYERTI